MKLEKANKRDRQQHKRKNGMRVSGKSVKLIQQIQINRANKAKKNQKTGEQIMIANTNMKVLFSRVCGCGNTCIIQGGFNVEDRETELNTYDENGNATCGLIGKSSVKCRCGKRHYAFNREVWHSNVIDVHLALAEEA